MSSKLVLFASFICLSIGISAQTISEPYIFPVRPGSNEWVALKTTEGRVKACQIPDSILQQMSTEALVKTCVDYPFFMDIFLYDNLLKGVKLVSTYFNGISELTKRQDAGKALLSAYSKIDPAVINPKITKVQIGNQSMLLTYYEVLMFNCDISVSMSDEEKKGLVKELLLKVDAKSKYQNIYSATAFSTPLVLIGNTVLIDPSKQNSIANFDQKQFDQFLQTGRFQDDKLFSIIYQAGTKFIQ